MNRRGELCARFGWAGGAGEREKRASKRKGHPPPFSNERRITLVRAECLRVNSFPPSPFLPNSSSGPPHTPPTPQQNCSVPPPSSLPPAHGNRNATHGNGRRCVTSPSPRRRSPRRTRCSWTTPTCPTPCRSTSSPNTSAWRRRWPRCGTTPDPRFSFCKQNQYFEVWKSRLFGGFWVLTG